MDYSLTTIYREMFRKDGAEKHGRVFVNMWDINSLEGKDPDGWHDAGLVDKIKQDWMHLIDDLQITSSSRYLRHNGMPLVAIWGVSKDQLGRFNDVFIIFRFNIIGSFFTS